MKLFIDIETVPQYKDFHDMPDHLRHCYEKKFGHELENNVPGKYDCFEDHYNAKAALFAEFGKIVCIGFGYMLSGQITTKSITGDEKHILNEASAIIDKAHSLVAHNGKDFDYPFLCRRMIINKMKLPSLLRIQNLKPWEIKLEDTVEMWKFGQFNYRASLDTMCAVLGVESPKVDGIDGSSVRDMFYVAGDVDGIAKYCERDVRALIQVYHALE